MVSHDTVRSNSDDSQTVTSPSPMLLRSLVAGEGFYKWLEGNVMTNSQL